LWRGIQLFTEQTAYFYIFGQSMKTDILSDKNIDFFQRCVKVAASTFPITTKVPSGISLHHYCSLSSLIGIIESSTIWTSNYKFMNDRSEGVYLLNSISKDHHQNLENEIEFIKKKSADIFIASFSEEKDDLYQWKLYGDSGKGVNIKFDFDHEGGTYLAMPIDLRETYSLEMPRFDLVKVNYNSNDQKEFFANLLRSFINLKSEIENPEQERIFKKFLYRGIAGHSSLTKSEAWKNEKEWRLVGYYDNANADLEDMEKFQHKDPLSFRLSSDNRLIPYYKYPIDVTQIKEIKFGPLNRNNFEGLENSMKTFFVTRGINPPKMSLSNIDLAY